MKKSVMIALALTVATPAVAKTEAPVTVTAPNMTTGTPLASEIAGKLFPDGTYRKMLGPSMTKMLSDMTDSMMTTMPLRPLLKSVGLPEESVTKLDKSTLGEIMAVTDPHYRERIRRGTNAMFLAMLPMFEKLEPDLRAGLAISLDNRFSSAELGDLKTFFATPTGSSFASQQMMLFMDPAVMGRMQAAMPKIMEAMPTMIAAMTDATKDIPKARTYNDLTPAERARLAALLGIDPKKAKK